MKKERNRDETRDSRAPYVSLGLSDMSLIKIVHIQKSWIFIWQINCVKLNTFLNDICYVIIRNLSQIRLLTIIFFKVKIWYTFKGSPTLWVTHHEIYAHPRTSHEITFRALFWWIPISNAHTPFCFLFFSAFCCREIIKREFVFLDSLTTLWRH